MRSAIAIAQSALKTEDVPVGALIVDSDNNVISTGYNEREAHQDPTAHAEIVAIRRAAQKLGTWRLDGCKLVVTLEPCAMCAGAIAQSRINTLILVLGMKKLVRLVRFGMCYETHALFIKWKLSAEFLKQSAPNC